MRSRRLLTGLSMAAAALALPLATAGTAQAAPAAPAGTTAVCIPEAPVCYGIRGSATTGYSYWFRFTPRPSSLGLTFTVNGLQASGTLTTSSTPTTLSGEFRPHTPLVAGDRVCMFVSTRPNGYCETVV
ncbi:hypothetical protein K4B79_00825 [Streptomyces lincolnensis]|uniref:hypothetical protein n=1 Tax=Streptomyces lincolnensis TaxID=1915 RepID=UPI001E5BF9AE|nr:hypothetical protein [Streptomyces lincolnensis]MCD7436758.1 hypothetical protein [Streptomyces lincolnensis]